jgi:hypothetical protein
MDQKFVVIYGDDDKQREKALLKVQKEQGIWSFFSNYDGFSRKNGWFLCTENFPMVCKLLQEYSNINGLFYCKFLHEIPYYIEIRSEKIPCYTYKEITPKITRAEFWNLYFKDILML